MRSILYVPGDAPDKLAKAVRYGADALLLDLEDAVPVPRKEVARRQVADFLEQHQAFVRVNAGPAGQEDLAAIACPNLLGVYIPKVRTPADLPAVDFPMVAILESAQALFCALKIAHAPGVVRLHLGEADLAADLGATPGPEGHELLWARSQVVAASAAAGLEPPMAPVSTGFRDLDALRRSTIALRRLGFRGRACIHPAQLPVVHEVFTPTAEELAAARDVLTRYETAQSQGSGVCVDAQGKLIDEAVVRSARRILSQSPDPAAESAPSP